ncbi:MAG: LacI family transcriptional regulator [Pseudomonas sp.]|nr:LacI family transcriptional regulator [Pseudomonas sp.]
MSKKHRGRYQGDAVTYQLPSPAGGVQLETFVPWTLVKRGLRKQIITPLDAPQEFMEEARRERQARESAQDSALLRALGLAHHWQRLLDEGQFTSITEIAAAEGMDIGQASRIARLTALAPDIVEVCADPTKKSLSLDRISRRAIPVRWDVQRARLLPA